MISDNSENSIRNTRSFWHPFFVTAVLCDILYISYSSDSVMRLGFQILLKLSPTELTVCTRRWARGSFCALRGGVENKILLLS